MTDTGVEAAVRVGGVRVGHSRGRPKALPYGEVRVEHGTIAIGVESLPDVSAARHALFVRAAAEVGFDPADVLVVRVGGDGIEVDAVDFEDPRWPLRTRRIEAGDLGGRARRSACRHDRP